MKKAFSLIELMIVIVIIGVVYTLVISKLQNYKQESVTPSFERLKEYLMSYMQNAQSVTLLCLDDCSECSIYQDKKRVKEIKSFFNSSVETYRYDFLQGAIEKKSELF
ncbi:MAG: prepilin-type N-terminal cleavage/methylation domain-containing protein [Sulfurimonas sp.]|nr:prepilin-type N-terminal cleavage/methylation domain-containing protein [Sulfurimonas sp.]